MKFMDMQPVANPNMTDTTTASRIQFIKMNIEGVTTRVRLLGIPYRRYVHFVDVEKDDGSKQRKSVICSNYNYDTLDLSIKTKNEWNCILDEVYDLQTQEFSCPHSELPLVSFPELPESFRYDKEGNAKPPQRVTFQANFLAINRAEQETDPENCIQLASFKKLSWGRVFSIGTGSTEGGVPNPDFAKGDPADIEKGYDIAIDFRKNVSPSEMYSVSAAITASPLTDVEKQLISNFEEDFKIEEYFKVKPREEIVEFLNKVRDVDEFPHGGNKTSTSDIIEAELRNASNPSLDADAKSEPIGSTPF